MVVDDELLAWFMANDVWDFETQVSVEAAGGIIPLHAESSLKNSLELDPGCKKLLKMLHASDMGINLASLGIHPQQWHNCRKHHELASSCLCQKKLARVQDRVRLKALPISFDSRVQFLVGLTASF